MKQLLTLLSVAVILAFAARAALLESYRVRSHAMEPKYLQGAWVLVNKAAFGLRIPISTYELVHFRDPQVGEAVLVSHPYDPSERFLRRIIAVGKDTVRISGGVLSVNGEAQTTVSNIPKEFGPVDVPPDHFFLLSDQTEDEMDSRAWGPVPASCILGKPILSF